MIRHREDLEQEELERLAPYACKAAESRGRIFEQSKDSIRTDFQRDRDRVIHCSAFRKLEFKTQVFVTTASDYHRTRLTHTMEVAQIGRTLARTLGLNLDLVEAIALAHDLGHTPFGHAGEDAMKDCMKDHGGFEHNAQGLRIVEYLEERYSHIPGLNLTFEVREGIIKHDTDYDKPAQDPNYFPGKSSSLESQIVDLADEIAYNCADLDDALKLGYLNEEDIASIDWLEELFARGREETGAGARGKYVRFRAIGHLYDLCVDDALDFSRARLEEASPKSIDDVRNTTIRLIDFSPGLKQKLRILKDFLLQRVYMHPSTLTNSERGKKFLHDLFNTYYENPRLMPFKYQEKIKEHGKHRVICDYISGMTDRYLNEQYRALFHPEIFK